MTGMDFYTMFGKNGWAPEPQSESFPILDIFSATFTVSYRMSVYAFVSINSFGLDAIDHIGVAWLQVKFQDTDNAGELTYYNATEIQKTIECAEDNLLKLGIPFVEHYEFHGKNKVNKKRRNDSLIRKLDVKAYEDECRKFASERVKEQSKIMEEMNKKMNTEPKVDYCVTDTVTNNLSD